MFNCTKCNRPLKMDEIALHKRMIDRGSSKFMCLSCMAKYFNVSEALLKEKADHFRKEGCTLFPIKSDLE